MNRATERHRANVDAVRKEALSEAELNTLRAEADRLSALYTDRVQRRAERAVRSLINTRWKTRLGAALRSTKGMLFPDRRTRWRYAMNRTGFLLDEITTGTLDPSAAWVNDAGELERMIERDGGSTASMLRQALEIGSDTSELAQVIIAARNTVKVPKRLERIAKLLEDAEAVYRQEHAAEIQGDVAKLRGFGKRSLGSRVPWASATPSSGINDSQEHDEPSREDDPDD